MLPISAFFENRIPVCAALLAACLSLCIHSTTYGQSGGGVDLTGTGGRHSIQGRLIFPSGQRADVRLKVRLESGNGGDITVLSDMNGSFSFQSLSPGSYRVVIDGGDFFESASETVFIEPGNVSSRRVGGMIPISRPFTVQVYLRPKDNRGVIKTGVLNAALASVAPPARKAYERGLEFLVDGHNDKAIEQLKVAVSLYPNFPLALNELGLAYLRVGQLNLALDALSTAVKLDPNAFAPKLNYGIALLQKKNFVEAKLQLQQALERNPNSAAAHLYLGITLIHEASYSDAEKAFLQSLDIGKQSMSLAHYYLGGLYWRKNEYKLAADELEKYLRYTPAAQDAPRIKQTIKDLRSKE